MGCFSVGLLGHPSDWKNRVKRERQRDKLALALTYRRGVEGREGCREGGEKGGKGVAFELQEGCELLAVFEY